MIFNDNNKKKRIEKDLRDCYAIVRHTSVFLKINRLLVWCPNNCYLAYIFKFLFYFERQINFITAWLWLLFAEQIRQV